jgi:hypothetical protein
MGFFIEVNGWLHVLIAVPKGKEFPVPVELQNILIHPSSGATAHIGPGPPLVRFLNLIDIW